MKKSNFPIQSLLLVAVAILSLVLGLWLSQKLGGKTLVPADLDATFLPSGKPLAPFSLVDQDGKAFDVDRLKGRWTFMFFGYTNCPDVCPTTLQTMKDAWKLLDKKSLDKTQMVFVSVDADRDPPAVLKKYVNYFHPDFIGVTGKPDKWIY